MLTFIPDKRPPRRKERKPAKAPSNVVAIRTPDAPAFDPARAAESGKPAFDPARATELGYVKPKHGQGWIRPPFAPGNSGRPPGVLTRYGETLKFARQHSQEAMETLVARLKDVDGRIAVVAANSLLERAWGKAREMKPEEQAKAQIDLSALSGPELQLLMRLVESGRLKAAPELEPASAGEEIEGKAEPPNCEQ